MKVIINLIGGVIGLLVLNVQLALLILPFILAFALLVYLFDSIFNVYSFMVFCFTLNGLFLGWSFNNKDKAYFYSIVFYTLFFGYFLRSIFNEYLDDDSTFILIASLGLIFGYGLYKLGFITFLIEIYNIYGYFKYDEVTLGWLLLYYRCKLKKLNVYIYGKYGSYFTKGKNTKETIITISNNGELSINSISEDEDNKKLSISVINSKVIARLGIYPAMPVIITGTSNIPARALFSLLTSLPKDVVDEVGLKPISSP
jgi:hypothetical protein